MESIFENAKFGDKFKTRDGRMALYLEDAATYGKYQLAIDGLAEVFYLISCDDSGMCKQNTDFDIVGKWKEPIDEEELTEMANTYMLHPDRTIESYSLLTEMMEAFKAGYRKAKEE